MKFDFDRMKKDLKVSTKLSAYLLLTGLFMLSVFWAMQLPYNAIQYFDSDNECTEIAAYKVSNYSSSHLDFREEKISPEFTSIYSGCTINAIIKSILIYSGLALLVALVRELFKRYTIQDDSK